MKLWFNKTEGASKRSESIAVEQASVKRSQATHLLHLVLFHINYIALQAKSSSANAEAPPLPSALFLQTCESNLMLLLLETHMLVNRPGSLPCSINKVHATGLKLRSARRTISLQGVNNYF